MMEPGHVADKTPDYCASPEMQDAVVMRAPLRAVLPDPRCSPSVSHRIYYRSDVSMRITAS
jgi:hypothetical protein